MYENEYGIAVLDMKARRTLAIDPGTTESAYVVFIDGEPVEFGKVLNEELVRILGSGEGVPCFVLAIEMPACYGMAVGKSTMETCRWVGVFQEAFGLRDSCLVYRKARNQDEGIESVTMHLCNSTRAKDPNVRKAIIDRYGGEDVAIGGKKCDVCKGKGWRGVGRPVCVKCGGDGWKQEPGVLHGVSADVWAALGVAITFVETWKADV